MKAINLSDELSAVAARVLARSVGLRLDPAIRGRLSRCVVDGAAASHLDPSAYVGRLDTEPALLQDLLDRVTVQESSFFRDPNQFAALSHGALGDMAGPVNIWSAGCANGQEAYSLAMTLADAGLSEWQIIASDISTRAVERTRQARYTARELSDVPPAHMARYFVPVGDCWQVIDSLRAQVQVLHHNLVGDPPPFPDGACDIVFCRNVLIYFRQEEVVAFLDRIARWLRPGGWLFLGYSESLWQLTDAFQLVRGGDAFAYRRADPARRDGVAAGTPARRSSAAKRRARQNGRSSTAVLSTRRRLAGRAVPSRTPDAEVEADAGVDRGPAGLGLAAAGEAALSIGDYTRAIAAFRKCAYLDPDQPVTHLHLGLALEAAGDHLSARRAFGAARRALRGPGSAVAEAVLGGYQVADLARLLDRKLEAPS